ncbi:MAG: hypothetical protein IJR50_07895 [Treponema sp.]|nr:hypothetical protein [Treponema sp.]
MSERNASIVIKKLLLLCTCCTLTAVFSCKTASYQDAMITGFVFSAARNGTLASDAVGAINQQTKIITVKIPASVYGNVAARRALRADIACAAGSVLVAEEPSLDYANSPVPIVVTDATGSTVTYVVRIEKQYESLAPGSLLFAEYRSGEYSPTGSNSQYIELENISPDDIELGSVTLHLHAWKGGKRMAKHDQSVRLSGTLLSGKTARISAGKSMSNLVIDGADALPLNFIVSLNGQTALSLTSGGVVLDALGPNDGAGNGSNWGGGCRISRKDTVTTYSGWHREEWSWASLIPVYMNVNYDFDGGMQHVLDEIRAGHNGSQSGNTTSINKQVAGILTCKEVFGGSSAKRCFFLQDKNAGLYFYISDSSSTQLPDEALVGNKIRVTVTTGKIYYDMPEVTGISAIEIIEDGATVPVYYETGAYNQPDCLGRMYGYSGAVEGSPDNKYVGTFSASNELYFHCSSALKSKLAGGTRGTFYGPVTYSYSKYRMEIADENQIILGDKK